MGMKFENNKKILSSVGIQLLSSWTSLIVDIELNGKTEIKNLRKFFPHTV